MYAIALDRYDPNGTASRYLESSTTTPADEMALGLAGAMSALIDLALAGDTEPIRHFAAGVSKITDLEDIFGAAKHSVLESLLDGDITVVNDRIRAIAAIEADLLAECRPVRLADVHTFRRPARRAARASR